eukprot:gnl/Chilomastix_caulleri/192.p1 GENE.gnl/Chilomastix_caulleri/192~~gnl/Chilomastix_caulleri/192.p1  ORF type:complete len:144 (-),score=13.26 gnl/Chilomastix_caulleri/192:98-529(-)
MSTDRSANIMRELRIEKLVLNCSVGGSEDKLTRATKVLEQLSQQKPVHSRSRLTVRGFGIRRNQKISAHVTIRGPRAQQLLERGLAVKEFTLPAKAFNDTGCFGLVSLNILISALNTILQLVSSVWISTLFFAVQDIVSSTVR